MMKDVMRRIVRVLARGFVGSFLALLCLHLASQPLAASEEEAAAEETSQLLGDISECYQLWWSNEEGLTNLGHQQIEQQSTFTWYCQARPTGEDGYNHRQFHSYKDVRMDARDFALFRCERKFTSCVTRCTLAPRSCAPHFWP